MLERINAAHKGVRSKVAAGYFSFSYFLWAGAKGGVTGAEPGSNSAEVPWPASDPFPLPL